jgi:hypothetical protein
MRVGLHEAKCVVVISLCAFVAGHFLAFGIRVLAHHL